MTALTLDHAETNTAYLPHPVDPLWSQATQITDEIVAFKENNPGVVIYDNRVDALVANIRALAKRREHMPESSEWTCPQRIVWRAAQAIPPGRRHQIVEDRSLCGTTKAYASINAGRWLIVCPFPSCHGAQYASLIDRRFWCVDCYNAAVGGQWVEVLWPDNPDQVEQFLANRPRQAKNWVTGETEDDIRSQDEQHKRIN